MAALYGPSISIGPSRDDEISRHHADIPALATGFAITVTRKDAP